MRSFEESAGMGLATLLMLGVLSTPTAAQALAGATGGPPDPEQGTITAAQQAQLIGLLDSSLQSLSQKARRDLRTGGYVMLGVGIGSAIGGAATLAFGEGEYVEEVGYSLLGAGALLSGLSLIPFKLVSEPERMYEEFSRMPADSPEQAHQKFVYWDRRFEEYAHKAKNGRIMGGISSIIVGVTGYLLTEGPEEGRLYSFIWPAFGGVAALLIKSEGEMRYETYRRAKEDITGPGAGPVMDLGLVPLREGGILGALRIRF
jgi:hypothetical protein